MNSQAASFLFASNPFATHRVLSGALRYQFPAGQDAVQLLETLKQKKWNGQIVGAHGTGKTTLLKTLGQHWNQFGRQPQTIELRDQQHRMPKLDWTQCSHATQLVVDGYEQLSLRSRILLWFRCRWRRCGLLVTTHARVSNFPVVFETTTSQELVRDLTKLLGCPMSTDDIAKSYMDKNGNVRETFMHLYDLVEASHRDRPLSD